MKAKTYYQQLKPIVLPHLEVYKDDFLKYDRERLTQKKPERFILCFRNTGTDFVTLDNWQEMERKAIADNYDLVRTSILPRNDRFILGEKGTIREMSMGDAIQEIQAVTMAATEERAICLQCGCDFHTSTGIQTDNGWSCSEYCKSKYITRKAKVKETLGV